MRPNKHTLEAGRIEILGSDKDKDDEPRRFRMLAYTGAEVSRMWGRAVFDLRGIQTAERIPILLDHDATKRAGFADRAEVTAAGLVLEGYLSRSTASGREVASLSDEGFPWQASVGLMVQEWKEVGDGEELAVNGASVKGPISVATKARLIESSFLMAGADSKTYAVALEATDSLTVTKEGRMSPEEFLAANADTVRGWKEEAAGAARVALRSELSEFLKAFPADRVGWAAERFAAGRSLVEAKADLCEVLLSEAKPVPAPAVPVGVGFNGQIRQDGKPSMAHLSLDERAKLVWESNDGLRAEFLDSFSGFMRACREGQVQEVQA